MSSTASTGGPVHAPRWAALALVATAAAAVLIVGLGLTDVAPEAGRVPLLAVGYALGAIGAVAFAATHRALVSALRNHPRFRPSPAFDRLALVAMWFGLAAGLLNAFLLATELAK